MENPTYIDYIKNSSVRCMQTEIPCTVYNADGKNNMCGYIAMAAMLRMTDPKFNIGGTLDVQFLIWQVLLMLLKHLCLAQSASASPGGCGIEGADAATEHLIPASSSASSVSGGSGVRVAKATTVIVEEFLSHEVNLDFDGAMRRISFQRKA